MYLESKDVKFTDPLKAQYKTFSDMAKCTRSVRVSGTSNICEQI